MEENGMKRLIKKLKLTVISIILILSIMAVSVPVSGYAAPIQASAVSVRLEPVEAAADMGQQASFSLIVEGLGTDPDSNQISAISFSSSDTSVADHISHTGPSVYTPDGEEEPAGLEYPVNVTIITAGAAAITATVTDTGGNDHTCSGIVTGKGIRLNLRNITLGEGEACVIFAGRYGLDKGEEGKTLSWSKTSIENTGWITMGAHGLNRQNEAYYVKGSSPGTGTVTVSLPGSSYSDTVNVNVIPKKFINVQKDGSEVTAPIELNNTTDTVELESALSRDFSEYATVTWESSDPDIVSVSPVSGSSTTIKREAYSDVPVAVRATATDGGITRTKTVYVTSAKSMDPSLKITCARAVSGGASPSDITINEGETYTLSTSTRGIEETATIWTAETDGGRVPVMLNSTVGKSITITGRSHTEEGHPITITATNGSLSDTVNVTVLPDNGEKSVKITGEALGADGVIALSPAGTADLGLEMKGFSENATVTWGAYLAQNSENNTTNERPTDSVSLSQTDGSSTTVTANGSSVDFAKVTVKVEENGERLKDEIYIKVTGCDIINTARKITLFQGDQVTLQTTDGSSTTWSSNSRKAYFGSTSTIPTTTDGICAKINTLERNGTTTNPVLITAGSNEIKDSVYVSVKADQWCKVYFDLNGGYGATPEPVVFSSGDTERSILLRRPDAVYTSDDGEYEFYGWSESSKAGSPDANRSVFLPGQVYTLPVNETWMTLYAIWTKKTEDALFVIRTGGNIGPEPETQQLGTYATSGIYMKDALQPAGFYFNAEGVEDHLDKMPSDADIARVLSLQYEKDSQSPIGFDPDHDRVVWYVIKRLGDDGAKQPNWHVDGVLVKGGKVSLTYDLNLNAANMSHIPNPLRSFYDVNDSVSITSEEPTCTGACFVGWNTEPDGKGQWYTNTGTLNEGAEGTAETGFIITEDTTLYAIWKVTDPNLSRVCSAPDVTVPYDGQPHGIKVTVGRQVKNAVVRYGESEDNCTLEESPAITNVSESGKVVYYKVTSDNYKPYTGSAVIIIKKANTTVSAPGAEYLRKYVYSKDNSDSFRLTGLPGDCGTVSWNIPAVSGSLNFTKEPAVTRDGLLSYTVAGGTTGSKGTITVKAGMQNYKDVTFTINIELVDQFPVKLKEGSLVTLQSSTLTYGQALSSLSFNTADFVSDDTDEKPVEGTLAWKEPDAVPDAGEINPVWIFTPADRTYASLEGTVSVTVNTVNTCSHPGSTLRNVIAATCTEKGYSGDVYCTICGALITRGSFTDIDPDNHAYDGGRVTKEASVLTEGEKTYTCTRCHHTYTGKIPRKEDGNDYSDLIGDTDTLSGDAAPKVDEKTLEDGSSQETVSIGGEEVSKIITDPESGKETVESKVWIGGLRESYPYTGSAIKPSFHVYDGTRKLTEKTDYTVSYINNKNAGPATIKLKFKENYNDTKQEELSFRIRPAVLGTDIIVHEIGVAAKKNEQKPVPVLTRDRTGQTVNSRFFEIRYYDKDGNEIPSVKEADVYRVRVTPKNSNYTGFAETTLTVLSGTDHNKILSDAKVTFTPKSWSYTGSEIIPSKDQYELKIGNEKLTEGTHFTKNVKNNILPGTATVVFEAVNGSGYFGTKTATFKITGKRALKEAGADSTFTYSLSENVPYAKGGAKPSVIVKDGETVLAQGTDYTLSYSKNNAVTTGDKKACITVKGKGTYKGSVKLYFSITQQALTAAGITVTAADQFVKKDNVTLPVVTVTDLDGKKLAKNTDFTIRETKPDTSAESNTESQGYAAVTIAGKGKYTGEVPVTFRYNSAVSSNLAKARAKKISDQIYTGSRVCLSNADLTGILYTGQKTSPVYLIPGKDFRVTGYQKNDQKGTAKVTLQGLGDHAGTKTLSFLIRTRNTDFKGVLIGDKWK